MTADPLTTARRRLVPGQPGEAGYRTLMQADGEQHTVRDDLAGRALPPAWHRSARPLLVIAQLSDTHVMDHQSPGRVELLDEADGYAAAVPGPRYRRSLVRRARQPRQHAGSATTRWRRW